MPRPSSTLQQFQEKLWNELPHQRSMLGREVVYDTIAVAIQEWPDERLAQADKEQEQLTIRELRASIRRHLRLMYGDEKFETMWVIALQIILPILVDQILQWWRRRKDNRSRLRMWRRKWVNGEEG